MAEAGQDYRRPGTVQSTDEKTLPYQYIIKAQVAAVS
jgi:hypothetical protein